MTKLGVDGENESEKFRNFIEFLSDYFETEPWTMVQDLFSKDEQNNAPKLEAFDFILKALKEHERRLDSIAEKIEKNQILKTKI